MASLEKAGLRAARNLALELYFQPHPRLQTLLMVSLLTPQEAKEIVKYFYYDITPLRHKKLAKELPCLKYAIMREPLVFFAGLDLRYMVEPLLVGGFTYRMSTAFEIAVRLDHQEMMLFLLPHIGGIFLNVALGNAALWNRQSMLTPLIKAGATDFRAALLKAAAGGHEEMLQQLLRLGATVLRRGLREAARGGNLNIFKFFLECGCSDFEEALEAAARGNQLEMVQLLFQKSQIGAISNKSIEEAAEKTTSSAILKILLDKGASNYDAIIDNLISRGALEAVQFLVDYPGTGFNYYTLAKDAAMCRKPDILAFMLDRMQATEQIGNVTGILRTVCSTNGLRNSTRRMLELLLQMENLDLNVGLRRAARWSNRRLVVYLLDRGATDLNGAMLSAIGSCSDDMRVVSLLLEQGATNYQEALWETVKCGCKDEELLELLVEREVLSPDYSELEDDLADALAELHSRRYNFSEEMEDEELL